MSRCECVCFSDFTAGKVRINALVAVFWKNWFSIEIRKGAGKKSVRTQVKLFQDEESDQCLH